MTDQETERELRDRLNLIENMIAEARRSTQNWGWTFVLWGVVFYVASAWSAWGHNGWAWPITTTVAVAVTVLVASPRRADHPETTLSRAVGAVWIAAGISMFVLFLALGATGRLRDVHVFLAVLSAMLAMANGASGMMLRWTLQLLCAALWWVSAVGACFGTEMQSTVLFLVAIFVCQILFGIYGMVIQSQWRRRHGTVHA